jgi:hypothetical protein
MHLSLRFIGPAFNLRFRGVSASEPTGMGFTLGDLVAGAAGSANAKKKPLYRLF